MLPPRTAWFGLWIPQPNPYPVLQGGSEPTEVNRATSPCCGGITAAPHTNTLTPSSSVTTLSFGFGARHMQIWLLSLTQNIHRKNKTGDLLKFYPKLQAHHYLAWAF